MFFIRIKSIKSTKNIKSTKHQTSNFLSLRCFHVHENAAFFVSHTKKHKKHKKHEKHKNHKDANKRTSDFPQLRCFYAHKNAVFFIFVRLYAFAFCACEIFLQKKPKKQKRFKSALIPPFTILLWCHSKSFRNEKSKSNLNLWI